MIVSVIHVTDGSAADCYEHQNNPIIGTKKSVGVCKMLKLDTVQKKKKIQLSKERLVTD